MPFHRLLHDNDGSLVTVDDYELGSLPLTAIWQGDALEELPTDYALSVDSRTGVMPDLLANPLSLFLVTERLQDLLGVQTPLGTVVARVFDRAVSRYLSAYRLITAVPVVPALSTDLSTLLRNPSGEISALVEPVLLREAADGLEIFRCAEFRRALFVSDQAAHRLDGRGITGVAFQKCRTT